MKPEKSYVDYVFSLYSTDSQLDEQQAGMLLESAFSRSEFREKLLDELALMLSSDASKWIVFLHPDIRETEEIEDGSDVISYIMSLVGPFLTDDERKRLAETE